MGIGKIEFRAFSADFRYGMGFLRETAQLFGFQHLTSGENGFIINC